MNKYLVLSCVASSLLFAGAATAPSWAMEADQFKANSIIFAEPGDQIQEAPAPQAPPEENDRDGNLFNLTPSPGAAESQIAQQEGEGSTDPAPKPEEEEEEEEKAGPMGG